MGRPKNIEEIEQTEEEINLPQKNSITKLSGKYIIDFSEDSYELSLRAAFDWRNRTNNGSNKKYRVVITDYYLAKHKNKAILVSYNIEEK